MIDFYSTTNPKRFLNSYKEEELDYLFSQPYSFYNLISLSSSNLLKDKEFSDLAGIKLIDLYDSKIKHGCMIGVSDLGLWNVSAKFIPIWAGHALCDMFINNTSQFASYLRQDFANICCKLIPIRDHNAIELFKRYYKCLNINSMNSLISKITGGMKNSEISSYLDSSYLLYLKYSNPNIRLNPKKRKKLIRDLAKYKNLFDRLQFLININKDDLKALSPVARFNLLKRLFAKKIKGIGYNEMVISKIFSLEEINDLLKDMPSKYDHNIELWIRDYKRFLVRHCGLGF